MTVESSATVSFTRMQDGTKEDYELLGRYEAEAEREDTWREIAAELAKFEHADGFVGPCEMLVGAGTK